jgi:hypothetical protein
MTRLDVSIPTSLGEIINIKHQLDSIKSQYSQIRINFGTGLWAQCLHTDAPDWKHKEQLWQKYLTDIGQLFFSESPYIIDRNAHFPFADMGVMARNLRLIPQKAELGSYLCKGTSLDVGSEYIVMTTKVRNLHKNVFDPKSPQLWDMLNKLSTKYKIVVIGEKEVERRREYPDPDDIYGIYDQIITNISKNNMIDLTVPALGETVSDLSKIQQDCLIMKEAKFVITIGIGGNLSLSGAAATMSIGFRADDLDYFNVIYDNKEYANAVITKNWDHFINTLKGYL